jgi:hypothetical protein
MVKKHKYKNQKPQNAQVTTRDANYSLADYEALFSSNLSFLGGKFGYVGAGGDSWQYDWRVPPQALAFVVQDPVIFGMIRAVSANIFKNKWAFTGQGRKSKLYTEFLKMLGWDIISQQMVNHIWLGSAGGNGLLYFEKNSQRIQVGSQSYQVPRMRLEPFLAEGKYRVKIFPDYNRREITKYQIVNWDMSEIKTLNADEVIPIKYLSVDGDFRFSNSPAVVAAKVANLKFQAFVASETVYSNGMNFNKILSPDFSIAKDDAMLKVVTSAWNQFTNILESTRGVYNRNKDIVSKTPIRVDNIGVNHRDMQTAEILQETNKEIQAAYGVALSNLGFTESANYSTSEQNRENISELNSNWLVKKLEDIIMESVMPLFFPDYDRFADPFVQSYDPSSEDLEVRQQNINTITTFANLEKILPNQFDIEDSILESIGLKRKTPAEAEKKADTTDQEQTQSKAVDETKQDLGNSKEKEKRSAQKKTPAETAINSQEYKAFESKLNKAFTKQLNKFVANFKDKSKAKIEKHDYFLPKLETFYSFPALKKDLLEFAKIGIDIFETQTKSKTRAKEDDSFGKYPQSVVDYIDQRTQWLLKGDENYSGLDGETSAEIETIIAGNLGKSVQEIAGIISMSIEKFSLNRAKVIAQNEVANAVEKSQYVLYKSEFPDGTKEIQTAVSDVCPICVTAENQGQIKMSADFENGAESAPLHIKCRCTTLYYPD